MTTATATSTSSLKIGDVILHPISLEFHIFCGFVPDPYKAPELAVLLLQDENGLAEHTQVIVPRASEFAVYS